MAKAIQRRRGTTVEHASFTGLVGELSVDTTKKTVVVHDGSTAGGVPLAKESALPAASSTTVSGIVELATTAETVIGTDAVRAVTPAGVAGAQIFPGLPQNSKSAAYTTVLADANKHILHPSADTTARIFTIDSNANVAFPIGTTLTFVNQNAGGVITIAITTDTMRLAGAGTTGSRTLAANGMATALKITSTEWIISGTGLT